MTVHGTRKPEDFSYLMTAPGHILAVSDRGLIQIPLQEASDLRRLITLHETGNRTDLMVGASARLIFDPATRGFGRTLPCGAITVTQEKDRDFLRLSISGETLHVPPGSLAGANPAFSILEPGDESGVLRRLAPAALRTLVTLSRQALLINNETTPSRFSAGGSGNRKLRFGHYDIPIEDILASSDELPRDMPGNLPEEFVFFNGWLPNRAVVFSPAIFFVVFWQGNVLDQFRASLTSLRQSGQYGDQYDGTVVVMTNNDLQLMNRLCQECGIRNVRFLQMGAVDATDCVAARFYALSSGMLDEFAPVLYADADVIFDRPVGDILVEARRSHGISAQLELHTAFRRDYSVGGTLYEEVPFPVGEDVHGFCSGLFTVPSARRFRPVFQAMHEALRTYLGTSGRESIPFSDQSIFNYVLRRFDLFTEDPITRCTRVWAPDMPVQGRGFVHFWPAKHDKVPAMQAFLARLISESSGS
ncbi:hypothetical protein GOB93_08005 [Acetobacter musti]|uniref:Uncharacterized protein n=1 Tax=Acetobacter musti TaxID=864732 RepID=A0ABX0JMW7_9PROT|nr:hypothetical protein [Acetobacter musti]NHN84587.1 hypothetical protein [Acetobacter musti]